MPNHAQYIYCIQPTRAAMLSEGPTPAEAAIVGQHFAYLQDLTERGVIVLAGRTQTIDPSSFGIVIFYAESDAAAAEIVKNDPAVYGGVMHAELFPFRVALLTDPDHQPEIKG